MKRPIIMVLVCVVTIAALIWSYGWLKGQRNLTFEEQRQLDATQKELRQIIDDLKAPPEAIFFDYATVERIRRIRFEAYAFHGIKDVYPYGTQRQPQEISPDGNVSNRIPVDDFSMAMMYSSETFWANRTPQACRSISFAFGQERSHLGDLLRKDRSVYDKEIRWRLLLLMESWNSYMALEACEALAAAGERSDRLRQRLERIYLDPSEHDRREAGRILRQCGWAVPPLPLAAASQPAFGEDELPAQDHDGALPPGAMMRYGETRLRHGLDVQDTAFSPDGLTLASCGWDNFVRLWDLKTGQQKQALPVSYCSRIIFLGDAQLLTQAGKSIQVWDLATALPILRIDAPKDKHFASPAVSSDKRLLAVGTYSTRDEVTLYELPSGKPLWSSETSVDNVSGSVGGLRFSPDGRTILCRAHDHRAVILDLADGRVLKTLPMVCQLTDVYVPSRDGKKLLNAREGIEVWDLETGKMEKRVAPPEGLRRVVADGNDFFVMGGPKGIARVDAQTLQPLGPMIAEKGIEKASISADGKHIAFSRGPAIQVWELATAQRLFASSQPQGPVNLVGLSRDGNVLHALVSGKLFRWNVRSGELLPEPIGDSVYTAAISPGTNMLVTEGGTDIPNPEGMGTITRRWLKVWDLQSGAPQAEIELPQAGGGRLFVGPPRSMFSPLVLCGDGTLCVWDKEFKRPISRSGVGRMLRGDQAVLLAPKNDEARLAVVGGDGVVQLHQYNWSAGDVLLHRSFNPLMKAIAIAASADGNRLLAAGYRRAAIWDFSKDEDLASPAAVIRFPWSQETNEDINSILWLDEEGLLLISRTWKGDSIDIVDLRSGRAVGRLTGHRGPAVSMVRRGDTLYTGSGDSTILAWDLKRIIGWCQKRRQGDAATLPVATRPAWSLP